MEQVTFPPITIIAAACAVLGRDASTGSDFEEAGLPMAGGCEKCAASVAAYNSCPSKSGKIRCLDCIGEDGFTTVLDWLQFELAGGEERIAAALKRSLELGGDECKYQESGEEREDAVVMRRALMFSRAALKLSLDRGNSLRDLIMEGSHRAARLDRTA